MLKRIPLALALSLPALAGHGTAWAAPGDTAVMTGTAQANVVAPTQIQPLDDLRFGQFYRPTANGNVTLSTAGAVTATGGMVGLTNAVQIGTGRGAARFRINGDANRDFRVDLPNQIDIFRGTASMRVSNFTHNVPPPRGNLGAAGSFILLVGARLRVNANQPVGLYQGTYVVTVTYQ
jgi:spore coat protein U-like protein